MQALERIMQLVSDLNKGDEVEYSAARDELQAMGRAAVKPLYMLHFSQESKAYIEIHHIFSAIGDDLFAAGGTKAIEPDIIKAMNSGAKKSRLWADEEVHTLAVAALTRWGLEVPPVANQTIHSCHICGKSITEERIKVCALHGCDQSVCRKHSHIIETRFGEFDGSGGAWFCTAEHYKRANHNYIEWQ